MNDERINEEHMEIMRHTVTRAPGGFYCGTSKEMQELVEWGYMKSAGTKPGVPSEYFTITDKGKRWLHEFRR